MQLFLKIFFTCVLSWLVVLLSGCESLKEQYDASDAGDLDEGSDGTEEALPGEGNEQGKDSVKDLGNDLGEDTDDTEPEPEKPEQREFEPVEDGTYPEPVTLGDSNFKSADPSEGFVFPTPPPPPRDEDSDDDEESEESDDDDDGDYGDDDEEDEEDDDDEENDEDDNDDAAIEGGDENDTDVESEEEDLEREIVEADVVHVVDDTLYALSRYRGVSVIDVSDPSSLLLLGRYQAYGVPFEMYIRDGVALALYSSFYEYEYDEETLSYVWRANSRVIALDVQDPNNIQEIGSFELLGQISDSRIVGDVLYAISFENGHCWGCDTIPKTTITSLNLTDLSGITVADRIEYEEDNSYWRRSIEVTTERMYVSGPSWSSDGGAYHSTLQVVDISDPSGDLVEGASVELAGQIDSRWQMNEHDGVLRIISQPGSIWDSGAQPVVETFQVVSSGEIIPLGELEMILPRPEDLRSVRFDKERAYAVTFERTDPLFVFDLSDPAVPVQLGELEIPGWLYHMEPRGDRLFAIGFDEQNGPGLAVSLFDVADPNRPTLIDKVHFGAEWGGMPEDQDRIHKAFRILDDQELILMPFAGWSRDDNGYLRTYYSGIQLIDFTRDNLNLRGVAPHSGKARRAFLHRDHLFAMSDERVDSFDIHHRDAPQLLSSVTLSRTVYRTVQAGDHVVELVSDWWTQEARLEVFPIDDPDAIEPLSSLDLTSLRPENALSYYYWNSAFNYYNSRLLYHGEYLHLLWSEYTGYFTDYGYKTGEYMTGIATFDLSDPVQPQLISKQLYSMKFPGSKYDFRYFDGPVGSGYALVQFGSVVVMHDYYMESDKIMVLDLTEPREPRRTWLTLSTTNRSFLMNGDGVIFTSHSEREAGETDTVRFYLDRIDLSDPENPTWLPKIKVPGTPIYYSAQTGRLVTVDYRRVITSELSWQECLSDRKNMDRTYSTHTRQCAYLTFGVMLLQVEGDQAVLLNRFDLDDMITINRVFGTETAVFIETSPTSVYNQSEGTSESVPRRAIAVSITDDNGFVPHGDLDLSTFRTYLVTARDNTLLAFESNPPAVQVVELTPDGAVTTKEAFLSGSGYELQLNDEYILCANGPWGGQTIPLAP